MRDGLPQPAVAEGWSLRALLGARRFDSRRVLTGLDVRDFDRMAVMGWCAPPVTATVVVREPGGGRASVTLDSPSRVPPLSTHLAAQQRACTFYFDRMHDTSAELSAIVAALCAGVHGWRRTGVRAAFSPAGCGLGIGFHADAFDALVVQLSGKRRWRVWPPEALPEAYHRGLLQGRAMGPAEPPRIAPEADVTLEQGDAMFIPACHGHASVEGDADGSREEGAPATDTFSLTLGFEVVRASILLAGGEPGREASALDAPAHQPFPEPAPGTDALTHYTERLEELMATLDPLAPRAWLHGQVERWLHSRRAAEGG